MKEKKYIEILKTSAVAIITLIVFSFGISSAWTGPTGQAPNSNIPAPINVGSSQQQKLGTLLLGPLIINSSTSTPASSGLFAFGTSTFYGKIISNEDFCINSQNGTSRCLTNELENFYDVYFSIKNQLEVDECTESYGSSVNFFEGVVTSVVVDLPEYCLNSGICNIFQTILDASGNTVRHRVIQFSQSSSGHWWSSDNRDGNLINGDGVSSNIASDFNAGTILIRDDRSATETSINQITLLDSSSTRSMGVRICNGNNTVDTAKEILNNANKPVTLKNQSNLICQINQIQLGDRCVTCGENQYPNDEKNACLICPSGSQVNQFGQCVRCLPGMCIR